MTLTKKHFKKLAEIISKLKAYDTQKRSEDLINLLIDEVIIMCKEDNYLFNEARFKYACGLEQ